MTTMIHEFELVHENRCVCNHSSYWNVKIENGGIVANHQFTNRKQLLDQIDLFKRLGYKVEVTEIDIEVKQTRVDL